MRLIVILISEKNETINQSIKFGLIIFSLVLLGCNKSEDAEEIVSTIKEKSKTTLKILNFKHKLELAKIDPIKNGDELMTLEDAVWFIEGALNYFNANDPIVENRIPNKITMSLDINPIENKITVNEISAMFDSFNEHINSNPENYFRVGDIALIGSIGNQQLKLTAILSAPGSFGVNDSDGPIQEEWDEDDINLLSKKVNYYHGYGFNGPIPVEESTYYTDVVSFDIGPWDIDDEDGIWINLLNPNDDVVGDNVTERLVPFRSAPGDNVFDHALTTDQLDYYIFEGFPAAIDAVNDNSGLWLPIENTYDFVYISEMGDEEVNGFAGTWSDIYPTFTYGVRQTD